MRILQINSFYNGSTGKIMTSINKALINSNIESYIMWARGKGKKSKNEIYIGNTFEIYLHAFLARITGNNGFYSKIQTKKTIKKIKEINPDIIHLHNIHGYYINIEELFKYLKNTSTKIIWTLHDCWAFTGHCAYFDYCNCNKWKSKCYNCPNLNSYPKSLIDNTTNNYYKKKQIFSTINNIVLVTPSKWLTNTCKKSFLSEKEICTIYNGVDLSKFKKTNSNIKDKLNIKEKRIILGVANVWEKRKGLDDFIKLSSLLDDKYQIVLIGLKKSQIKELPNNILGIKRTDNQEELVKLYSAADYYFNPSVEETFGLTTLEALACKTQCIVYNATALSEIAEICKCFIVEKNDVESVADIINNNRKMKINNNYHFFSSEKMINNYITLYDKIYKRNK